MFLTGKKSVATLMSTAIVFSSLVSSVSANMPSHPNGASGTNKNTNWSNRPPMKVDWEYYKRRNNTPSPSKVECTELYLCTTFAINKCEDKETGEKYIMATKVYRPSSGGITIIEAKLSKKEMEVIEENKCRGAFHDRDSNVINKCKIEGKGYIVFEKDQVPSVGGISAIKINDDKSFINKILP